MNIKNKKMIGNIYFFSFFKRAFICFLCIILCFNVVCKPKRIHAATLGVAVAWGLSDYLAALLASAGLALTVDAFLQGLGVYNDDDQVTEDEALQWCKNNITIDGDNNVVFTDDAKAFINDYLLGTYKDSVTMVYRYPVKSVSVSAENFPNKISYDYFQKILLNYSDCCAFFLPSSGQSTGVCLKGWPVTALDGSEFLLPYDETSDGAIRVNIIPRPFAGVSNYLDLASASTTLYNDDWETSFFPRSFWILPDGRVFTYSSKQILGYGASYKELDIDNLPSYDDLETEYYWSWYGTSFTTFSDSHHSCSLSVSCLYSANPDPINVYKSETDMKKDIGSQVIGNFVPDYYTGTPNYNITTSEVNNIVNNYYPSDDDSGGGSGSGSGSDDSGGSSSGGSGIIDGLGKLFGAIGNIIDKLFGFVLGLLSKVVDFFGSILEMFTDTLTKLIDIIPTGFNEFLAAMFPYIPEEMITIAQFIMLVSAIGCVVALFKR